MIELIMPMDQLLLLVLEDAFWSAIAAVGFAVLFNTPRNMLFYSALVGAAGHALRAFLVRGFGVDLVIGTLVGATLVGVMAFFFARRTRTPALVFSIIGCIPMVPGRIAFEALIALISYTSADPAELVRLLTQVAFILGALAVGSAMPSLLLERQKPVV